MLFSHARQDLAVCLAMSQLGVNASLVMSPQTAEEVQRCLCSLSSTGMFLQELKSSVNVLIQEVKWKLNNPALNERTKVILSPDQ